MVFNASFHLFNRLRQAAAVFLAGWMVATAPGPVFAANLAVVSASYLGLSNNDVGNAVDSSGSCPLLIGGKFSANDFGQAPVVLGVAGTGAVLCANANQSAVSAVLRIGSVVTDLAVRRGSDVARGDVAIAADTGLALVSADLKTLRWLRTDLGAASRVDIAADGTVAALFGKVLRVFDAAGTQLMTQTFGDSAVNDVAIDGSTQRVFVTGFAQRNGAACSQLQVAWIRSYDYMGNKGWSAYDWPKGVADAQNECADTRGRLVSMGRDGLLYFAGTSAGGNSIFRRSTHDLTVNAPNISSDPYNSAYNTASNHITYFARVDPATGEVLAGQFLLTRLSSTKGNTIEPRSITADERGIVLLGGFAACCLPNRGVDGQTLADYAGGDAWVASVSPDFKTRYFMNSLTNGGKGTIYGALARGRVWAVVGQASALPMYLKTPLQTGAGATSAGYSAVIVPAVPPVVPDLTPVLMLLLD